MRVAALYDVHANVRALEAVLPETDDADVVLFGGDLVAGPWPLETLELARSLGDRARFIRGNWERAVLGDRDTPTLAWLRETLEGEEIDWPETLSLDGVLYCHATPTSDAQFVLPQWAQSDWSSFAGPLVVCGHTHLQYETVRNGTRIVNPGSVGNPTIRATPWWATIEGDDVELRTTDYDTTGASAEMRMSGHPDSAFADELIEPYSVERLIGWFEARA